MRRALLACVALTCFGAARAATDQATVKRGEYLARMADCEACHLGTDGTLSGGRAFATPFGTIHASNLTPDPKAGVGTYSDDEWVAALQRGVGRSGHLYPAMPYTNYTLMSREDALAIRAWIMMQPSSPAATPANDMHFPFNIRFLMVFWNLLYNPDHRFVADGAHDAAWNRGAYLAEALGHCQQCHTPRNFLQGLKSGQAYAGAVQQGWRAYNITGDARSGVGGWSDADLAAYLATGHADGHGVASGPMAEAVSYSLRYLTPEDAAALAHYMKAIPAIRTPVVPPDAHVAEDELGARIYAGACASCHRTNGTGAQTAYGALAGAHSVAEPDGTNLVQVMLQGGQIATQVGVLHMPGFARGYTEIELAAVANYTIAHFGQRDGRVSPAAFGGPRAGGS